MATQGFAFMLYPEFITSSCGLDQQKPSSYIKEIQPEFQNVCSQRQNTTKRKYLRSDHVTCCSGICL